MIAIIDYGRGNLGSVEKAFERLGLEAVVTHEAGVVDGPHVLGDRRGRPDSTERLLDGAEVAASVVDYGNHRLASPPAAARTAITTRLSWRARSR